MPKVLLPIEYGQGVLTRHVDRQGKISFGGHKLRVGMGCTGMVVGLRPVIEEKIEVYFCHQQIAVIDMSDRDDPRVSRVTRSRTGKQQNPTSPSNPINTSRQRNNRQRTR